jgi:hypothetical protein
MPIATAASSGPLSAEHHRELALAKERGAKVRRAAGVAAFNGWITGVIAACSALVLLFSPGIVNVLATAGLAAVAYNEFRGRNRLLAFEPSGATLLGWNQLGLLAMITTYCGWMIYTSLTGPLPVSADTREALKMLEMDLNEFRYFYAAFYGLVILLSVLFQGLNAAYYFSRRKHVEAYVRETPQWVRDVQRATAVG